MARSDRDDEHEWHLVWRRRAFYILLALAAVAVCVWFVHWVSTGLGMDRIGEHYKQADEF
ncbi:hypothetical protein [Gemmata sp.]|uniref:hypothetical protein n=1 Tax=Gemmata sp. TaxID=1914242 RepID=UPI003F7239B9